MKWIPIKKATLIDDEVYVVITTDGMPFSGKWNSGRLRFEVVFDSGTSFFVGKDGATHVIAWSDVPQPKTRGQAGKGGAA